MFDIAIVGTGPSGISAAITSKLRNKDIILIGNKDLSDKLLSNHPIKNYPGFPDISGNDLQLRFKSHLDNMDIEITEDKISMIYAMGTHFVLQGSKESYQAKTVIISTGVKPEKELEGEKEFLGRGVSYCATCDAPLYKNKEIAVIAESAKEENEVRYLANVASHVYFFPMYGKSDLSMENVKLIYEKPEKIEGTMKAESVVSDKEKYSIDGIFILRDNVAPDKLVPGLKLDKNHIGVNRKMETNIAGLFACGDVTGLPYQYVKAAGEGNVAALSAVKYLTEK